MLKYSHRESILHSIYQYLMKGWISFHVAHYSFILI